MRERPMKKNNSKAIIPVLALALLLAAITFSFAAGSTRTIAAPSGGPPISSSSSYAPLAWTDLLNVSSEPYYDNTAGIAASPIDAGLTIAWEERDEGVSHSFGAIKHASNTGVGRPLNEQRVNNAAWKQIGNVSVKHDSLGNRHMVYFEYNGSNSTCGYYAIVNSSANLVSVQEIPGSCNNFNKNTAIAVGPDDTVHVILGRDGNNLRYFQRNPAGQWVVQDEVVTNAGPTAPSLAVSTNGVVMAIWLQGAGTSGDVISGRRDGPGQWVYENISAVCCTGCEFGSRTYSPAITADRTGGLHAAWADEQCVPRTDPRSTDMYYRQWQPQGGWDNNPIVLVDGSGGQQFWSSIAVDNSNKVHIGYSTDENRGRDDYTFAYLSGRGTTFSAEEKPYAGLGAYLKQSVIAHGPGHIFAAFNSNLNAPQFKTIYYAYNDIPDPGLATPTPVATNTPLPPRCPTQRFTDVCPGDFFYTSTLALDDRGVLNGYNTVPPCDANSHIPCFKPFNNITRAQTAKVIVLAANLPADLEGAPHFQDVAPNSTFYNFIEFAYNAGVIGGYPCGGPGEPCIGPENRPYYRPGNNVTRGQLSKMASEAFNFNDPVTGQRFQDVPPTNPFYLYVERLASRGVIGGYPCGGPGEPCIGPANLPYFRPNANVTRGQASKIVYETMLNAAPTSTPIRTATSTIVPTNTAIPPTSTSTSIIPTITLIPQAGR